MRTKHDVRPLRGSRRVKHALKRFKERYGRELKFEEYWQMVLAIRSGQGEIVKHRNKGSIYQLVWRDEVIYPTFTQREVRGNIISTFLEPYMVLHQVCFPYWSKSIDRNRSRSLKTESLGAQYE